MPIALPFSRAGYADVRMATPVPVIIAAAKPWNARNAITDALENESEMRNDATAKRIAP